MEAAAPLTLTEREMSYEAIINAIAALLGGGAIVGIGKLVMILRKSKSESRAAAVDTKIKESQAETSEWKQIVDEMRKQVSGAEKKIDRIRDELQSRMDDVQAKHLKCELELATANARLDTAESRLLRIESKVP